LLPSEKRSLVRFLVIYLFSTLLLFGLASWIFYSFSKHQLLDKQKEMLKYEAEVLKSKLRILHQSNEQILVYPVNNQIKSAIYDLDKRYIFGTYDARHPFGLEESNHLYYRAKMEPYYLGAAYIVTSKKIDYTPIITLQKNVFLFMLLAGLFFATLAYLLGHLFVAPMRESLEKMNHFIQDTTHELNTPISTILTNIEMIETFGKYEENNCELKRIEIASKTLSRIYDDLTYLNLNHQYHRTMVNVNISELIAERLVYFTAMIEAKKINVLQSITQDIVLRIDKNDALRLIDNLLSNAIKYNKPQGLLEVSLTKEGMTVHDTGIGIKTQELKQILHRFKRANKSEGGFGIGLHIVSQVCESYGFDLDIQSVENRGTEVYIRWSK